MAKRMWRKRMEGVWVRVRLNAGMMLLAVTIAACGSGETPVEPVNDILPFVGTWEAEVFTFTSISDPTVVERVIESGGTFTTNIQPSGNYTSTFTCCGLSPFVEFGRLSVNGSFLTFTPQTGSPATSSFNFITDDYLEVEGERAWNFNFDPTAQPAIMHQELRRTNQ